MYLTHTSEQQAIDNENQVYYNYIMLKASHTLRLVWDYTNHYIKRELEAMTIDEVTEFRVYWSRNWKIITDSWWTSRYATINKSVNEDKWFFPKPDDTLMKWLSDYSKEEKSDSWFAVDELDMIDESTWVDIGDIKREIETTIVDYKDLKWRIRKKDLTYMWGIYTYMIEKGLDEIDTHDSDYVPVTLTKNEICELIELLKTAREDIINQ